MKIVGLMKVNKKSLITILTDKTLRFEWDLDLIQSYNGYSSKDSQGYIMSEYQASQEVTTFEEMHVEGKDFVIETIKLIDNKQVARVWEIEPTHDSQVSLVTMHAQITTALMLLRGEDTGNQFLNIFSAIQNVAERLALAPHTASLDQEEEDDTEYSFINKNEID
jgi:hypothetical protein